MTPTDEQRKMLEEICRALREGRAVFGRNVADAIDALLAPPRVITDASELVDGNYYLVRNRETKNLCMSGPRRLIINGLRCSFGGYEMALAHFNEYYEANPVTMPPWPEAK